MSALISKIKNAAAWRWNRWSTAVRTVYAMSGYRVINAFYRFGLSHFAKAKRYSIPLPELGIKSGNPVTAGGGQTSWSKWELIRKHLPVGARSAMDIGSNNGFFSLRLAQSNLFTLGIEPDIELLRLAQAGALAAGLQNVAFASLPVDEKNVTGLPKADVTLVLSVAQRWAHVSGREGMTAILKALWDKTGSCMFFEIPNPCQSDKEAKYLLWMGKTEAECEQSIVKWLKDLGVPKVELLGYLPTDFRPGEKRHLFLLSR